MKPSPRFVTAILAAASLLAACGSGDSTTSPPAVDTTLPADSTTSGSTTGSTTGSSTTVSSASNCLASAAPLTLPDELTAVIPADIPDDFVPAIGPVEMNGTPLPILGQDVAIDDDPALCAVAPVVLGQDFDGHSVRIDAAADGPTMVVFLAHWCPHCNNEIPRLLELRDDLRYPEGLNIIAVSTAPSPDRPNYPPGEWLKQMDWTYPAMKEGVDAELQKFVVADAFGVNAFPFVVLIDGEGHVAARFSGEHEPDEIIDLITNYLGMS